MARRTIDECVMQARLYEGFLEHLKQSIPENEMEERVRDEAVNEMEKLTNRWYRKAGVE